LQVYTSALDDSAGEKAPEVLMQDRLKKGRQRLDIALESLALLCEPVPPPQGELEHIRYFCGNTELPSDLQAHEPQRVALYKSVAALVRAYANIADDLPQAGYDETHIAQIKRNVDRAVKLREVIRQASGETIDLKAYEADMRHLIDTYIEAEEPRRISNFGEMGLLALIEKGGMAAGIASLPDGLRRSPSAVAETIANNVRSKIIKEHLNDPAFYDKMSALLQEILADLRAQRLDYEAFLKRMEGLVQRVQHGQADDTPKQLDTPGKRALFNLLQQDEAAKTELGISEPRETYLGVAPGSPLDLALRLDKAIKTRRPDAWRGVKAKELSIKGIIHTIISDADQVERLYSVVFAQTEY
jgi:type I restriction enzyme R subunit